MTTGGATWVDETQAEALLSPTHCSLASRRTPVWVHGDRTREATEYFWVHLSSPSHVTLGHTWAKGTIVNDD
jgi:hypothetical protein